ncbi:MAG TPA: MBL fold metallo-hydrolase [Candidatus Limnocylindrales bacterium]|nr:MBL fold metallo-hydrolase [Candidatus Limnocylindrales bacterium]
MALGGGTAASDAWLEVGERVFVRRYRFLDQEIGAILTDDGPVVIDTRSTVAHAREVLDDLRRISKLPVAAVIDTHHHFDHTYGNHEFRPAPIWGHVRCASRIQHMVDDPAAHQANRAEVAEEYPRIAGELSDIVPDPPDQTVGDEGADIEIGGRRLELRWLGRGHTDNDLVIRVPHANVVFAGDLLENGAPPWTGDGYPLDWPQTAAAILALTAGSRASAVVPGHGAVGDRAFVERSLADLEAIAGLAHRVHAGELGLAAAVAAGPWPAEVTLETIERGLAQLRGELD